MTDKPENSTVTRTPYILPASLVQDYGELFDVLVAAFKQAATGKGQERHGSAQPFSEQTVAVITEMVGPGFALGQVMKKAHEASRMMGRGNYAAAHRELLGCIVYAASAALKCDKDATSEYSG